jgi:hypothetical protein
MELFGVSGPKSPKQFFQRPCKIFKIPLKSAKTEVVIKSPLKFGKTNSNFVIKNGQIPTVPAIQN